MSKCDGSGTQLDNLGHNYLTTCPVCGKNTSATTTGKIRAHTPKKAYVVNQVTYHNFRLLLIERLGELVWRAECTNCPEVIESNNRQRGDVLVTLGMSVHNENE